jgi:hypothetical protein
VDVARVEALLAARLAAKLRKDYDTADAHKAELRDLQIEVSPNGYLRLVIEWPWPHLISDGPRFCHPPRLSSCRYR